MLLEAQDSRFDKRETIRMFLYPSFLLESEDFFIFQQIRSERQRRQHQVICRIGLCRVYATELTNVLSIFKLHLSEFVCYS